MRRIAYTGDANRSPTADVAANPTSGPLPLAVDFDASGEQRPRHRRHATSYLWDFGDGSPTQTTTTPTTSHTYSTKGTYTASLRVEDNHGAVSDPDSRSHRRGQRGAHPGDRRHPPPDLLFRVGQQITLSGSATDPEDGQLPQESLEWEVLQHHNGTHTHPVLLGDRQQPERSPPRSPEGLTLDRVLATTWR